MKKLIGMILILFLGLSGVSEMVFLKNGKIIEGKIVDINKGIVVLEVEDYKHIFPVSNISYIFFTKNINLKNGIYLKNGIEIKKYLSLINLSGDILELSNGNSKLYLNKNDIDQLSFLDDSNESYIKIEDSVIKFTDIISLNEKEHTLKNSYGSIKINFDNLEKFSKSMKAYILNKDDEIYFLKNLKITEKGINIYEEDLYYIKNFNSLIKIDAHFNAGYNSSNDIYTIKTKENTFSGEFKYSNDALIIDEQMIKSEDIISINKNLIFRRKMNYSTSGYNDNEYFIIDKKNNLFSISEKGLVNLEKVIQEYDTDRNYIDIILGAGDYILLRDDRKIFFLDSKTFELKKSREFSYSFTYKLIENYLIIYSPFNTEFFIYDIKDLSLLGEYNINIKANDVMYWNNEIYLIYSSFLYKFMDGDFKVLKDFGVKLNNIEIINEKIYLIAYDSVFIYDGGKIKEIKTDIIYGYKNDGENLFLVSKNNISTIKKDEIAWDFVFDEENYRSNIILIDEHIYTIFGNNLYRFDKDGNFEIIFSYNFDKSLHNLYKLKEKYLLITCQDEFLQLSVND